MSDDQPQVSGVLATPPVVDELPPPPRQPSSLQGLLRLALATSNEDDNSADASQFNPIDEERKTFLEDALRCMTVNVTEIIARNVQILKGADSLSVDSDITEYLNAFDEIMEYVDRIDTAIDFHKIGGFVIFDPCLNSIHAPIRARACNIIAEISQCNPYCQDVIIDTELFDKLLDMLETDTDEAVQIKSIYAISCIIRENRSAYDIFLDKDGINLLIKALQKPIDKVRVKASFLLACLCNSNPELKDKLVKMGMVPMLIGLFTQDKMESHEQILKLLFLIIWKNAEAKTQCQDPRYNLKNIVIAHLTLTKGLQECREETQLCQSLLAFLFEADTTDTDR